MTKEIIQKLEKELKNVIVFDELYFIESKKFSNHDKALYLIFGAINNKINKTQRISYGIAEDYIHIDLHPIFI